MIASKVQCPAIGRRGTVFNANKLAKAVLTRRGSTRLAFRPRRSRALKRQAETLEAKPDVIISGATGVQGITEDEQAALTEIAPNAAIHATGDVAGHMMEGQAPAGIAIAAALIARGQSNEALVTSVGHWRGEGSVRVTRAS